jgi:ketosteroid isomerase-like protein
MRRLGRGVIVLIGCALVLAGCGVSAKQQVEAKVQEFAHATANRDYATLCNEVLAPALVAHLTAAGISCKQAMKVFTQSVKNPTISVSKVTVNGSSASAVVLAKATGQPSSREAIQLIKTSKGWRLDSLASAR